VIALLSLAFVVIAAGLVAWTSKPLAGPWAGLVGMLALLLTARGLSI
jgi:hypothetical protein